MKKSLLRRGLAIAALAGTIAGPIAAAVPAAAEIAPPGTNRIAAAGSDTTEAFMESYLNGRTTSENGATDFVVTTHNIVATGTGTEVVPGDADCPNGGITYGPASNSSSSAVQYNYANQTLTTYPTPNGSGAGRKFLKDERGTAGGDPKVACIDIARSSSFSATGANEATFQYFAFALDAVAWATKSLYAPATLTATQIRDIYRCQVNNWSQVGGSDMPIQRILPNPASGTRSFFLGQFGITASDLTTNSGPNGTCPALVETVNGGAQSGSNPFIQENDGRDINKSFRDSGIYPYSAGRWAFQANQNGNPNTDIRRDTRLGGYTTGAGFKGVPVEFISGDNAWQLDTITNGTRPATVIENNVGTFANPSYSATNDFRGIRYLFNVVDSESPSYNVSRGLIGFNNIAGGLMSALCDPNNAAGESLGDFGFARLDTANPLGTTNLAGSVCRRYAGIA